MTVGLRLTRDASRVRNQCATGAPSQIKTYMVDNDLPADVVLACALSLAELLRQIELRIVTDRTLAASTMTGEVGVARGPDEVRERSPGRTRRPARR